MPENWGALKTDVTYKLPETVQSLVEGWLKTFESSAVASVLFAGIESQLLGPMQTAAKNQSSVRGHVLLALTYIAFFCSISATMTSLVLTDSFGEITLHASRSMKAEESVLNFDGTSSALLKRFNGGKGSRRWVKVHWFSTLIIGYLCFIVQIVLYVFYTEAKAIAGIVVALAVISVIPLLDFFPWTAQN
ncbi:hypothetical protein EW026_g4491 [Hermanssonia centrifuga]|uniref:Uncharacterized protein n=1 Tax=Hermanssonia centrifuga TaxID=98765 RepID=A0A4S4KI22_9APHY|nr:hypothetical protein EW026_g4491 [Hermanssonia centrifuga]